MNSAVCCRRESLLVVRKVARDVLVVRCFGLGGVDLPGERVRAEGPAEEEDVGLGLVDLVVVPAAALRDAKASPLLLTQQARLAIVVMVQLVHLLRYRLRKDNMTIFIHVIVVLVRVLDLVRIVRHWVCATRDSRSP